MYTYNTSNLVAVGNHATPMNVEDPMDVETTDLGSRKRVRECDRDSNPRPLGLPRCEGSGE